MINDKVFCREYRFLDAIPDGVILVDRELKIRYWNRVVETWTGLHRNEMIGAFLSVRFPHLGESHFAARLRDVAQGGPPAVFSSSIHKSFLPCALPDGRVRQQQVVATFIHFQEGQDFALITIQDVTNLEESITRLRNTQKRLANEIAERKKTEEALLESERRLSIATRGTGIGIWDYDPKADRLVLDAHMFDLFQMDAAEFAGTLEAWHQWIAPEAKVQAKEAFRHALAQEDSFKLEFPIRTQDGSTRILAGSAVIIRDAEGNPVRVVGVNYDITEKAMIEKELQQSKSLMEYIIHHDLTSIALLDRELRFLYVSNRFLEDFGVTREELVGREYGDVFPAMPPTWTQAHARALRGEVSHTDEEVFFLGDGRKEWLRWECRPWYGEDGLIGGIILYTETITARKQMEENLVQMEKTSAVGQLAAGIAHNFNNQLTGVIGYADILYRGLENPKQKRYAENVLIAARRSAELTRQMLEYSRMQVNLSAVHDINAIIHEVVSILSHSLDSNIQIHQHLNADPSTILCDSTQIQNALLNIAINARDAMPEGGELIFETSIEALDADFCAKHPYVIKPGRYLRICVTDTGCGIPAAVQPKVFDPFFTTKEPDKGIGMGLASVYGSIKQHKGAVRVYSEEGHGTTVTVLLPYTGEAAVLKPQDVLIPSPTRHATILVIDDEGIVRSIAKDMLESLGYDIVLCDNGRTGLEYYLAHHDDIDLVLLDMVMPEMNGSEVFDRMREAHPDAKVLLSSGYSMNATMRGMLERGILGFVQKPFDQNELSRMIHAALQESAS